MVQLRFFDYKMILIEEIRIDREKICCFSFEDMTRKPGFPHELVLWCLYLSNYGSLSSKVIVSWGI